LRNKIGRNSITCEGTKRDRYGRFLGTCYINEVDLNSWMVQNGYALAYRRYSRRYVSAEQEARENSRGVWAGEFVVPWSWRKGERLTNSSLHPGK
ncbi:MAG: thermonuclease family protein, partial [Candidatus Dadabacteria bacterium]|nr:thermonuclease family protein [Candidatus Dadabacteria bacterium]